MVDFFDVVLLPVDCDFSRFLQLVSYFQYPLGLVLWVFLHPIEVSLYSPWHCLMFWDNWSFGLCEERLACVGGLTVSLPVVGSP